MTMLSRWLAPAVFATGLGVAGLAPAPAQAQGADDWVRVIVDVAVVMYRSGQPYYRYGNYGNDVRPVLGPICQHAFRTVWARGSLAIHLEMQQDVLAETGLRRFTALGSL